MYVFIPYVYKIYLVYRGGNLERWEVETLKNDFWSLHPHVKELIVDATLTEIKLIPRKIFEIIFFKEKRNLLIS